MKPSRPRSLNTDAPRDGYPVVWVRVGAEVEVRAGPSADAELLQLLDRRTEYGSPTVLGVVRRAGAWGAVETPTLGNGELGWVRLDRARMRSGYTNVSVSVDLSDRTAALRVDRRVVRSFAVTVGAPGTETPTGRFAVTDTFRGDLNPAYGCCALALTATQPHLPSGWLGGNRIAIHGTSGPLGVAASHGCVRAANEDVSALIDRVPLGAPVFIRG